MLWTWKAKSPRATIPSTEDTTSCRLGIHCLVSLLSTMYVETLHSVMRDSGFFCSLASECACLRFPSCIRRSHVKTCGTVLFWLVWMSAHRGHWGGEPISLLCMPSCILIMSISIITIITLTFSYATEEYPGEFTHPKNLRLCWSCVSWRSGSYYPRSFRSLANRPLHLADNKRAVI